jgi:hypothetical protein
MASNNARSTGFGSVLSAMADAVQWRLLLLWLVIMLIPATVVALPLRHMLGDLLDNSVHADDWAQSFNAMMFSDTIASLAKHPGWFGATATIGVLMTLLLSPFLNGIIVGSGRAGRVLGFGALLQNGFVEYGRMFRVMLWSLLPYAVVMGVASVGMHMADKHAERAVLESQADTYRSIVHWVLLIVFVLAQLVVESARAAFIADIGLRSATRALGRGFRQVFRRPLWTVVFYLIVTLIGLLIAAAFGMARIHVTAFGAVGFLFALVLSQLIVLAIGWMRTARLFALADVARSVVPAKPQAEYR